ncbi:hypothetical protein F4678DRAFT_457980 [Xylaria arbuscula]|nr:hypothetical protein F4678DRAFT_457980 [Xylaria arbuscula]
MMLSSFLSSGLVARDTVTLTLAQPQATLVVSAGAVSHSTDFQDSAKVRAITSSLAVLAFILTVVTYWALVRFSAPLSNQVVIPSKFLSENMNGVLQFQAGYEMPGMRARYDLYQLYTQDTGEHPSWEPVEGTVNWKKFKNRVRMLPKIGCLPTSSYGASMSDQHLLAVLAGSPAMKSIVQASIWEWVAVWLAFIALVNTAIYNGFVTGDKTSDMVLRLLLVSIYAGAVVGHALYITHFNIYSILSCLVFQATWELLIRSFAIMSTYDHASALTFEGTMLGETKVKELIRKNGISQELDGKLIRVPLGVELRSSDFEEPWQFHQSELADPFFDDVELVESILEKKIKVVLESEIKIFEKSAEAALDRTMASIAILLGICLATGLSPWTSTKSADATSTQLGSYALLLSVSTGLLALVSSLSHFSTMTDSAFMLLKLKEHVLAATPNGHLEAEKVQYWNQNREPDFGFSPNFTPIPHYQITTTRLLHLMTRIQRCWSIFLGPILPFLPIYPIGNEYNGIDLQVDGIKLLRYPHMVYKSPDAPKDAALPEETQESNQPTTGSVARPPTDTNSPPTNPPNSDHETGFDASSTQHRQG